jgi:AraC family transcriptional regulator of adaptative response/methylated-DNA-[protein]-cysteine methyltransferase
MVATLRGDRRPAKAPAQPPKGRRGRTRAQRVAVAGAATARDATEAALRFACGTCSLGSFLVATSAHGLRVVFIGDDPAALTRSLRARFPGTPLLAADAALGPLVAQVAQLIEQPQRGAAFPIDLSGTAFQRRVWQALVAIPAGQTRSYGAIATAIGEPTAARAVARACAANPLAVVVPCHRALRADGKPSGYRWGLGRKRELLAREASACR